MQDNISQYQVKKVELYIIQDTLIKNDKVLPMDFKYSLSHENLYLRPLEFSAHSTPVSTVVQHTFGMELLSDQVTWNFE